MTKTAVFKKVNWWGSEYICKVPYTHSHATALTAQILLKGQVHHCKHKERWKGGKWRKTCDVSKQLFAVAACCFCHTPECLPRSPAQREWNVTGSEHPNKRDGHLSGTSSLGVTQHPFSKSLRCNTSNGEFDSKCHLHAHIFLLPWTNTRTTRQSAQISAERPWSAKILHIICPVHVGLINILANLTMLSAANKNIPLLAPLLSHLIHSLNLAMEIRQWKQWKSAAETARKSADSVWAC